MASDLPDFDVAIRELACRDRRTSKPSANRASEIGAPKDCLRRLVYARTNWQDRVLPNDYLMGIFQTGNEVEQIVTRNLVDVGRHDGFQLIETQKTLEWPEHQIVGHCDGLIAVGNKTVAGLEIKSVGARFESLRDIDSLMTWDIAAKWYGQSQIYMMLSSIPLWALLLVQKNNLYNTRTLWLEFDPEYAEMIVKRAEGVNAHIEAGTLPDKLNDPRMCTNCGFAHICMPDMDNYGNLKVIDDDDIEAAIIRMNELDAAKKEYDAIERVLKEQLKAYLPEATADSVGEPCQIRVGDHRLCYVGSKRSTKPTEGGTTFHWRRDKKLEV